MSLHTCFPCVRSIQATRKKGTRPPGRHPGLCPQPKHAAQTRERASTGSDKLSANGKESPNNYKNNSC